MFLALLAAFTCGALLAIQSRIHGILAGGIGTFQTAWWSFGSGALLLCLFLLAPRYREHVARIPAALRSGGLRWWQLLGGVCGGLLVAVQAYAVPLVGVAAFLIAIVGGQVVSALLVDKWGLGPAGAKALSTARVLAAAVAATGVAIAATAGGNGGGTFGVVPVALAFVIGLGSAVQQAFNGQVGVAARDSLVTAHLNFATGLLTLLVVGAVAVLRAGPPDPSGQPWWVWVGGILGICYIALAAWAVRHIGILLFGLVTITSQMSIALALDLAVAETRALIGPQLLIGIGLTVLAACGAALAANRERRPLPAAR
ncbi:hypothetical protein GCM10009583_23070 [Ornithinicoccus hortensis]|uniref:Transporter family-2 protein n=1 Tax=Ornithinicoccus hortensis TaxID=82346 RepID=A0A542YQ49_9MICO|nr:transporter family-2 protein [Ornithinicoccus hortensis]